ncbi:hypothetical protein [Acinetobacter guillouiae]|uniref:hypothetical protein n=1 Tax=Acinetobacter guillouiae TaxID=106649 RepID=UPI00300956BB
MTGFADAIQGFTVENISGLQKGTNLDIDYVVHKVLMQQLVAWQELYKKTVRLEH